MPAMESLLIMRRLCVLATERLLIMRAFPCVPVPNQSGLAEWAAPRLSWLAGWRGWVGRLLAMVVHLVCAGGGVAIGVVCCFVFVFVFAPCVGGFYVFFGGGVNPPLEVEVSNGFRVSLCGPYQTAN